MNGCLFTLSIYLSIYSFEYVRTYVYKPKLVLLWFRLSVSARLL